LNLSGTSTVSGTRGNGGTVIVINGGGTATLSGTSTISALGVGTLRVCGPAALSATGHDCFANAAGGTLDLGADATAAGNNFDLQPGANLKIGSTAGISASGLTGNVQNTNTRTFSVGANYTYNNPIASQVTGDGLPLIVNSLTVGMKGTLTPSNASLAT